MHAQSKIVTAEKDMGMVNKIVKFTDKSGCTIVSRDFTAKPIRMKQEE
jgi:hypothetical protein